MDTMSVVVVLIIGAAVACILLYFVVKAAVRDGIAEAKGLSGDENGQDSISKIKCVACGKEHEMDDPKCPFCGHVYFE